MGGFGSSAAVIPSMIVHFIALFLSGFQAWNALRQYKLVQRTPGLWQFASKPILTTKKLAAVSGMFGFWYNLVIWIFVAFFYPGILWTVGLIDSVIMICLAVAAKRQAEFTPTSIARCSGDLNTWITDGGQGLFEAVTAAQHNVAATPRKECEQWNSEWLLEIVLV